MTDAAVEMKKNCQAFGGLQTVIDVSLPIHPGRCLALSDTTGPASRR